MKNDKYHYAGSAIICSSKDLDMPYRSILSVVNITATGTISSNSLTTNTLTTSGVSIHIKSDIVLFRGLDNSLYRDVLLGGVLFYSDV